MLASELFGHVRGAFTGAVQDRPGLFVQAHGGTLFLDEVAEIPLDIQARLLRVLQDQQFTPVGGTEVQQVDVRIVAATHRALRREVEHGRFRADLMYRIRVVPIYLPPLRERQGDIELLSRLFIDQFNRRGLRQIDQVSDEAAQLMAAHLWRGNVRELRNVIEHAFVMGEGPLLQTSDLTPELRGEAPDIDPLEPSLASSERQRILSALNLSGGRKGTAAHSLGMSRSTLWRKMREHGL
jgi:two-component system response regulator AtoC